MTKLAPIMGELFPYTKAAAVEVIDASDEMREWTERVRDALQRECTQVERGQVERDIIQSIFVDCLYMEQNDVHKLERWTREGGLW
ncbi:hypothetical protein [Thermophilibacter provencensis]|uniref:Uncharacterized protein n=1 Tax=Thermophilibacter provencensis TaxID=1852386 RepID=A0A921GFM4_9ACTN|nr:hypothetical protein [Thermophilibacter provencensis]HJF45396.1 hypothetical protein [Thermophilibacter provencensis]